MGTTITVAPGVPISLAQAKAHVVFSEADDDTIIAEKLAAATRNAEGILRRSICEQTIELSLDAFPSEIELLLPPVVSVSSIVYLDTNGNQQTLSAAVYQEQLTGTTEHKIKPAYGQSWPDTRAGAYNAVTITYLAGYGTAEGASPDTSSQVPEDITAAILLILGALYANREDDLIGVAGAKAPTAAHDLLGPYICVLL